MKRCIIIQGPTNKFYVDENKKCWENHDIIFSTWEDADRSAYNTNDNVLYNKYPLDFGPSNWNLQRTSTLNGIIRAKEMGYDRIVKWREDFKTNNAENLLKLFNPDKTNFYAFMDHEPDNNGGYITDFFMEGDINEMYDIFSTEASGPFPERILTNRVYELGLDKKSNFICKSITEEANVYWHKRKYWMIEIVPQQNYLNYIKK